MFAVTIYHMCRLRLIMMTCTFIISICIDLCFLLYILDDLFLHLLNKWNFCACILLNISNDLSCTSDSNVRTACLTCIGAVLAASPPLNEVTKLLETTESPRAGGSGTLMLRLQASQADNAGDAASNSPLSPADNLTDLSKDSVVGDGSHELSNSSQLGGKRTSYETEPATAQNVADRLSALAVDDRNELRGTGNADGTKSLDGLPASMDGCLATETSREERLFWLVRLCSDVCLPADTLELAASSLEERYVCFCLCNLPSIT